MRKIAWIVALLVILLAGLGLGTLRHPERGTRRVRGVPVPTGNATYPALEEFAGTPGARAIQKVIAEGKQPGVPPDIIVEGPPAFSEEVRRPAPELLDRIIHKSYIWTHWQLASSWDDKVRLGGPPTHFAHPLLKPADLLELLDQTGEDGRPALLPADLIVSGIGGIATHVSLYVGKDQGSGEARIVHALSTPVTQQSYGQMVANVMKSMVSTLGKMGVVEEGLGEFIGRFQRDTFFIVRDPRLTDEMRGRGVRRGKELVGRDYDYDMSRNNESLYCTEVVLEMLKAAYEGSGLPLPWIGTTPVHKRSSFAEFPVTPNNILASPDFVVINASETGWRHLEQVVRSHVVGKGQAGTL